MWFLISLLPFPEPRDSILSLKMSVYFPLELLFCHFMQNISRFIIFFLRHRTKDDLVITLACDHGMPNKTVNIHSILLRLYLILLRVTKQGLTTTTEKNHTKLLLKYKFMILLVCWTGVFEKGALNASESLP